MKRQRVHILLFSEKSGTAQRVSLPSLGLATVLLCLLVSGLTFAASLWGATYYYTRYHPRQSAPSTLDQQQLLDQIGVLYQDVSHDEKLVNTLESALEVEMGEVEAGKGPIPSALKRDLSNSLFALPMELTQEELKKASMLDEASFLNFLQASVEELKQRRLAIDNRLDQFYEISESKVRYQLAVPDRWPLKGWLTSGFGFRHSPVRGGSQFHSGLDIASPIGTEILAPSNGIVSFSGWKGGYGRTVVLDHGFGFQTVYGHNSKLFVKEGEIVKRGARIALVGRTGKSTGPHLHYEVHVDGVPVNPLHLIHEILE